MNSKHRLPIKESTREFYREGKKVDGYSWIDFLHGYVYGRWPYLYIAVGTGEHPLADWLRPLFNFVTGLIGEWPSGKNPGVSFADTYHGKVVPPQGARELVTVAEDISLTDLEPIIPYARAKDIILKHPDHIVALECPCRSSRDDPCLPLDVCLIVGEPFSSFILDHQTQRARAISPREALTILEEEHDRGHVHHAFFKDAMLNRFYAICNCCSCCCGAMHAQQNGTPMLTSSGYTARLEEKSCTLCGECMEICQFEAVSMMKGEIKISEEKCMGCGLCAGHCEQGAIKLQLTPEKGEPLVLHTLLQESRSSAETQL
mgnify:CR=1 FL=1